MCFQRKYITGHGSTNYKPLPNSSFERIIVMTTTGIMRITVTVTVTVTAIAIVKKLITMKLTLAMIALAKPVIILMIVGDTGEGDK